MELLSLFKYFSTVVLTGDFNNIWIFTLPPEMYGSIHAVGEYIAGILF